LKAVEHDNMLRAARQVVGNKGAPGIDQMAVDELLPYLERHYRELVGSILNDSYRPRPVRRVEIPKPDGGIRLPGVPTVIDRMVQQALAQVLVPIYESVFSDHSYGFRPGRSAQDAVRKALGYYNEGCASVVDLDMAKYFDTINHDKLLTVLKENVDDEGVCNLIRRFLKSGVMIGGLVSPTTQGAPQGGPQSPILSNIYRNCSGASLLRAFSVDESLDEEPLKVKSKLWIPHVGWSSSEEGILIGKAPC
jgi:group II intron reverse transcriptase/maturase